MSATEFGDLQAKLAISWGTNGACWAQQNVLPAGNLTVNCWKSRLKTRVFLNANPIGTACLRAVFPTYVSVSGGVGWGGRGWHLLSRNASLRWCYMTLIGVVRRRGGVPRYVEGFGVVRLIPVGSMYAIYANIGGILMVNVTIYIHI